MTPAALSCISWNIHRGLGKDKRFDPVRTADVLLDEVWQPEVDILALQEADLQADPQRGFLDIARIEARTGLVHAQRDAAYRWGPDSHGFLGVVLFVAPHVTIDRMALLDLPGHCHRGAVVVDMRVRDHPFCLVTTHLSLGQLARIAQMRVIGQYLHRHAPRQTVLIGDLNEWRPWGGLALSRRLLGVQFSGKALRSFPTGMPLLPLDRIMTTAPGRVEQMRVLDGPGIRIASDHRPVMAKVTLGS